jgi:hypothetical protein
MATAKELEYTYKMRRLQVISTAWQRFIHFCCVAVFCSCFYFSVRELAGKQTSADLVFKAVADLKSNRWMALTLSWMLTGGTTGWAVVERRLRKRHIKRVSSEASEMQSFIDAKRRSSNLSKRGDTAPEDI